MFFEFDEREFRSYYMKVIPVCSLISLLVLLVHYHYHLHPVLFLTLFLPTALIAGGKGRNLKNEILERNSITVFVGSDVIKYNNSTLGYAFERKLSDVIDVKLKNTFNIPVIVIQFTSNEAIKLSWLKNPDKFIDMMRRR